MKRASLILLAVLLAMGAFSQTKEETITWLNSTGLTLIDETKEVNVGHDHSYTTELLWELEEINENTISTSFTIIQRKSNHDFISRSIIKSKANLHDITEVLAIGRQIKIKTKTGAVEKVTYDNMADGFREKYSDKESVLIFRTKNKKSAQRIQKAIYNLAKLRGANVKAIVNENTF